MGQEALPPSPAAVAFSWEQAQGVLKPASVVYAPGMPQSPAKPPATVALSWDQGMTKPAVKPRAVLESARKAQAPTRRLSVPPPPGRVVLRAVRPEDDPFLAAYLDCTKSTGGGDRKKAAKGQRRIAWSGLRLGGLSCKRGDGAVAQSMVSMATFPELDPRDA